jgi:anti-anti-sigma factor
MDVQLVPLDGEWTDRPVPVVGKELVIGRAATCGLQIDHSLVSNEHCRVVVAGDRVAVEDLDSTFGTTVNGRKVHHADLRDRDRLKVGPATFLVALGPAAAAAPGGAPAATDEEHHRRGRDPNQDTAAVEAARQIFERLTGRGAKPEPTAAGAGAAGTPPPPAGAPRGKGKARLQVEASEGIALVNILDRAIIQDNEIQQIGQELDDLIQGGQSRIVVDFGNVKHMSSQAVGILLQAQKRCKAAGGLLKLCNPNPEVAEIFKITNLPRVIEIHPDDDGARQSPWPEASEAPPPPKPKPPSTAEKIAAAAARIQAGPAAAATRPAALDVRLVIEVGKSKGKAIKVAGPSFLVGRDATCGLRPASEAISRVHTRIDQRDGKVFVRDMGTTNGTALGTRVLRDEEAEAHDGDALTIGPLAFTFRIAGAAPPTDAASVEDAAASWLLQSPASGGDTAMLPTVPAPGADGAPGGKSAAFKTLRARVVGDVLLVTVVPGELEEEEQVGPVRHELIALLDEDVPRRLVLRMERVTALSDQAVAMLMAHYQRLDRLGGGLRFCGVREDVLPALEGQRAAMLVQVYPSAESAIKDPWPVT